MAQRTDLNQPFALRAKIRAGYRDLIFALNGNYFITFNFGYLIKPDVALDRMKGFCAALERKALGRKWHEHAFPGRLKVVGFPERLDLNPHWHAVAFVPDTHRMSLRAYGDEIWAKYAARGQLWVERIENPDAVESYCTKRLHKPCAPEHVFLYCANRPKS